MPYDFCFRFSDKLKTEKTAIYYLGYYYNTEQLDIEICKGRDVIETSPGTDTWDIFYNHATFEEILQYVIGSPNDEIYDRKVSFKKGELGAIERTKIALQIIRESPLTLLTGSGRVFAEELVMTLRTARWSTNKQEATEALNLLKDHLLPKRIGGRMPLPSNIDAVKAVMDKLALYLSRKCKKMIERYTRTEGGELNEYEYQHLSLWAREQRELRISCLPQNELSTLVFRPKTYIQDLLEKYFRTSIKTIKRSQKS